MALGLRYSGAACAALGAEERTLLMISHRITRAAACCALVLALGGASLAPVAAAGSDVKVALVTSKTGLLGAYGNEFLRGLHGRTQLRDARHRRRRRPQDRRLRLRRRGRCRQGNRDDQRPDRPGLQDHRRHRRSGIALQIAPLAQENNILYLPLAAADALTGINRNTFRSDARASRIS